MANIHGDEAVGRELLLGLARWSNILFVIGNTHHRKDDLLMSWNAEGLSPNTNKLKNSHSHVFGV